MTWNRHASRPRTGRPSGTVADVDASPADSAPPAVSPRRWRAVRVAAAVTMAVAAALLVTSWTSSGPAFAQGASAPTATECNPPAFPTGAGFQVTCTIAVQNTVTAQKTSSTVTATACLAAAGVLPPQGCTTTTTTSNQLVTSVNQCNGIVDGGGSNVTCRVTVTNDIPTGTPTSGVTVDQCVGSGTGGGTAPTVSCTPTGSTTNATVTQCNSSGNGGGASLRVKCTVTGTASALPVTIDQCNSSGNGGGSTVTCDTAIENSFTAGTTTTTAPPGATTTTTAPGATTTTTAPGATTTTAPPGATTTTAPTTTTTAPEAITTVPSTPTSTSVGTAVSGPSSTTTTTVAGTTAAGTKPLGTSLAYTGLPVPRLLTAAFLLLLAGCTLVLTGRRRRRAS